MSLFPPSSLLSVDRAFQAACFLCFTSLAQWKGTVIPMKKLKSTQGTQARKRRHMSQPSNNFHAALQQHFQMETLASPLKSFCCIKVWQKYDIFQEKANGTSSCFPSSHPKHFRLLQVGPITTVWEDRKALEQLKLSITTLRSKNTLVFIAYFIPLLEQRIKKQGPFLLSVNLT